MKNKIINRVWAMPNSNTFSIKPIKELLKKYVDSQNKLWIDPFANNNKFATVTNDINDEYKTDFNLDALDFLKTFNNNSVDGVLFDPPYSTRQVSECYKKMEKTVNMQTTQASFWSNLKKEIQRICRDDAVVISCAWNSGGIGKKYGFDIEEILLVPHGGWHNDTIVTVERIVKIPEELLCEY